MNIRNLPSHRFELYLGISTNLRPDELATGYMRSATNVDSFGLFRGLGTVPGSTAVSADHGTTVRSLHYFEFFDLSRTLQRQHLSFAADGVLRSINPSTGALTTLASGLADGILRHAVTLNRIHFTSPEQRGLDTGGLKYDGTRTTNWGVLAPGTAETVQEAFDDFTDWTDSTDATTSDSPISIDGAGSVAVAKDGTSSTDCSFTQGSLSLDFSALGQNALYVYLFLPSGVLQQLATSAAVTVDLGTSGLTNYDSHTFDVGELVPGWNLLVMDVTDPDTTGGSGATLSSITNLRFRLTTSTTGQTFSGVLWDHMYSVANGTVTAATGSAGNLTGDYTYRVAFLTEYGVISNGGPVSATVSPSSDQVDLSTIPVSDDPQVIARLIYRDISGDAIYRFVDQINDNVTTTYTDDIPDASLGATDLPLAGDSIIDNSPLGRLHASVVWQNRIIGIDADDRYRLIIGEVGAPEAAKIVDQIVLEENLIALEPHAVGLLIYSSDSIFRLAGDGVNIPFFVEKTSSTTGANSFRSAATYKNTHLCQHEDKVYFVENPADPWFLNKHRLDHFRDDITNATLDDGFVVHDRSRFRVLFFNKGSSGDYDQIDVWQYGVSAREQVSGDGAGVDPQDIRYGAWFTLSLPASVNPHCAEMMERTADLPELWVGGEDGYVYWLQDPSATTWAEGASTSAISSSFETIAFPIGSSVHGRGIPRYLKLHLESVGSATTAVTVTILSDSEGATIGSSSFNISVANGLQSIIVPIPQMGIRGEWCRINVSNPRLVKDMHVFYLPRTDFRASRAA